MDTLEWRESYGLKGHGFVKQYKLYREEEYVYVCIEEPNLGLYELHDFNLYEHNFSSNSLGSCMIQGLENYYRYLKESRS